VETQESHFKRTRVNTGNSEPKPLILAVETSSRIGSVAVALGANMLGESTFSASLRHSAEIFPTIAELLGQSNRTAADIDQVHISLGPGSFTGLRIAVAAAKSMHLASSVRIVTVDSLDTIAANVTDAAVAPVIQESHTNHSAPGRLATVLDAKRGQFYIAVYERSAPDEPADSEPRAKDPGYRIPAPQQSDWRKVLSDGLMTASELTDRFATEAEPLCLVGDGLLHHQDQFKVKGVRILDKGFWSPRAAQVHTLGYQKACAGRFADPLTLAPFYLRGPQVTLRKTAAPAPDGPSAHES